MKRGEIRWYTFRPPNKRRPVLLLLHVMRHGVTMGAPLIAIQALAGQTTAKSMHLTAGVTPVVRVFDEPGVGGTLGARLDSNDPNP